MKRSGIFSLAFLLLVVEPVCESSGFERQPVKRELQLVYVVDDQKPEFIFVIGQSGFKSVASLEKYLQTWPPGSELKWAPGCERFGGEPLLSSEDEMRDFRAFLAERHIKFILVPSG